MTTRNRGHSGLARLLTTTGLTCLSCNESFFECVRCTKATSDRNMRPVFGSLRNPAFLDGSAQPLTGPRARRTPPVLEGSLGGGQLTNLPRLTGNKRPFNRLLLFEEPLAKVISIARIT